MTNTFYRNSFYDTFPHHIVYTEIADEFGVVRFDAEETSKKLQAAAAPPPAPPPVPGPTTTGTSGGGGQGQVHPVPPPQLVGMFADAGQAAAAAALAAQQAQAAAAAAASLAGGEGGGGGGTIGSVHPQAQAAAQAVAQAHHVQSQSTANSLITSNVPLPPPGFLVNAFPEIQGTAGVKGGGSSQGGGMAKGKSIAEVVSGESASTEGDNNHKIGGTGGDGDDGGRADHAGQRNVLIAAASGPASTLFDQTPDTGGGTGGYEEHCQDDGEGMDYVADLTPKALASSSAATPPGPPPPGGIDEGNKPPSTIVLPSTPQSSGPAPPPGVGGSATRGVVGERAEGGAEGGSEGAEGGGGGVGAATPVLTPSSIDRRLQNGKEGAKKKEDDGNISEESGRDNETGGENNCSGEAGAGGEKKDPFLDLTARFEALKRRD